MHYTTTLCEEKTEIRPEKSLFTENLLKNLLLTQSYNLE